MIQKIDRIDTKLEFLGFVDPHAFEQIHVEAEGGGTRDRKNGR